MPISRVIAQSFLVLQSAAALAESQIDTAYDHLVSRRILGPSPVNSVGEVNGPLGIENHGLGKIIFNENRPIDSFILNGNLLIAVDRNGSCYVNPDTTQFHCEDVPDEVPHSATKFGSAPNGTILFRESANWWACPAQNPDTFDVLFQTGGRKPSPYCKFIQLKIGESAAQQKRTDVQHQSETTPQICPFTIALQTADVVEDQKSYRSTLGPFLLSGKSLLTGHHLTSYCFIEEASRQLLCLERSSTTLMENWHNIEFSVGNNSELKYGGSSQWFICIDNSGKFVGPFDSKKKESDPKCVSALRPIELRVRYLLTKDHKTCVQNWPLSKDAKNLDQVFASRVELHRKHNLTPSTTDVTCPTNLVNTLFKSPNLVIPVASTSANRSFGNSKSIDITPTQNTVFKFFIPFTQPYYGKLCSMVLLIPEMQNLHVDKQAVAPALEFSILDREIDEDVKWSTLPKAHVLTLKRFPQDVNSGKNHSITTFPCDAGRFQSFMIASRGGLSLSINQGGVPHESGLHIVPCA